MIKAILRKLLEYLPVRVKSALFCWRVKIFDMNAIKSYSQEGEDMILNRIFEGKREGFYVDIGAHHPSRFSNTNMLQANIQEENKKRIFQLKKN